MASGGGRGIHCLGPNCDVLRAAPAIWQEPIVKYSGIIETGCYCWNLEINYGGSIYTMKIDKQYKPGLPTSTQANLPACYCVQISFKEHNNEKPSFLLICVGWGGLPIHQLLDFHTSPGWLQVWVPFFFPLLSLGFSNPLKRLSQLNINLEEACIWI